MPPRLLVGSQIQIWEVKEGLKLDNLRTNHVMTRSEIKYYIGAKIVELKCRVFGGKTAPFPTVRVIRVVRPGETVRFQVQPNPVPTWEFGPVANNNDARRKIVHTQLQDVAGSISLLVLIIKAANKTNEENHVPKLIFCT